MSLSLYNHKGFDLDDTQMVLFKYLNGLTAKYRLRLKKVVKTTKPFRYDLNQTPYDYTLEVTNRFKGSDLLECLKNYGWRVVTLYRRQGSRPPPRKRNAKRQNGCLRRPYKWL